MIFATVGTHYFDALVCCLDDAVKCAVIDEDVVIQIGHGGKYTPRHCRYFRTAPSIEPFERAADLIIGHGGTGTTLEILAMGKPLISVANPMMKDNHQDEFLAALEQKGLVTYCKDLNDLPQLIAAHDLLARRSLGERSQLAAALDEQMGSLPLQRHRTNGWLSRLARWIATKHEIDPTATLRNARQTSDYWQLLIDPRQSHPVSTRHLFRHPELEVDGQTVMASSRSPKNTVTHGQNS